MKTKIEKPKVLNSVELSEIVTCVILDFCENLAELGYRPDVDKHGCSDSPDMWFRYLPFKKQLAVGEKLMDIMERDYKRFKDDENDKPKKEKK